MKPFHFGCLPHESKTMACMSVCSKWIFNLPRVTGLQFRVLSCLEAAFTTRLDTEAHPREPEASSLGHALLTCSPPVG